MVRHNVLIKLQDPSEENIAALSELMLSAKENIPSVKDACIRRDILHTPVSFDLMFTITFDDPDGLRQFIGHPYHTENIQKGSEEYIAELRLIDTVE